MIVHDCEQLSPTWFELRRGVPSASQFGRIITAKTGKLAAAHEEYLCELVAERLCQIPPVEKLLSPAMRHGVEFEPEARRWFEFEENVKVQQVGFITTDCGRFGCSPDGLVGDCCGLELKCPQGKTHVRYLMDGTLPDEYRAQVHGSMIVTGRASWWFVSYCPGLPPLKLLVLQNEFTFALAAVLAEFHDKLAEALARFTEAA